MFVATISADRHATLAQSVERFTRNEEVPGSSPGFGSSHRKSGGFFLSEKSRPKRRNAPAAKYLQINADIPIIMPIFGNPDNRVHIVTFLAIHCPAYL